jgi:hypothetical protein
LLSHLWFWSRWRRRGFSLLWSGRAHFLSIRKLNSRISYKRAIRGEREEREGESERAREKRERGREGERERGREGEERALTWHHGTSILASSEVLQ